ncbi:hypothetical protein KQI36_04655 [Clostridium senegalense]|uniref:hypothetical protein n=1 Tax=Clostridium senegalense TaxID=1465809 RepID=UPI001C127193|nr:hypothetical protein [Clostridium senegalense]MBU5225955.1 hypothetical protein [Clostridium senegalense]
MKLFKMNKTVKVVLMLNVCAVVMALFSIFNIYASYRHISNLVLQGFDPSKQIVEVINFYLTSITPYAFYGISLFTLGYIIKSFSYLFESNGIRKVDNKYLETEVLLENKYKQDEMDDEIDELLREIDI